MRTITIATFALILLSGCGGATPSAPGETSPLAQGLAAYRAADEAGLTAAIAAVQEKTSEPPAACSPEAFAADRRASMRHVLEPLDVSPLLSMSEEARYVFLDGLRPGVGGEIMPDDCKDAPGAALLSAQDNVEQVAIIKTVLNSKRDWHEALVAKYGDGVDARLAEGGKTLKANHLGDGR